MGSHFFTYIKAGNFLGEEVLLDQQRVVYMLMLMYGLFTPISHLSNFHHFTVVFNLLIFVYIELEWFPTCYIELADF